MSGMNGRRTSPVALALALTLALAVTGPAGATEPPVALRVPQVVAADAAKTAVLGAATSRVGDPFVVVDGTGQTVLSGTLEEAPGDPAPWSHAALADFSAVAAPGSYRVVVGAVESAPVRVEADPYPELLTSLLDVYDANADGREPSTYHGPSHLHDARSRIRNGPHRGERIDVTGGWMDSGDQLKFTVTVAYAATLLQLAARTEPDLAADLAEVADVGVRWLLKAHPAKGVFVAQVGDVDADHNAGFRDPTVDDGSDDPLRAHRPSSVLTRRTGGADVAGLASAALALAAQRADGRKRARLLRAAEQWFAEGERLGGPWRNCCYSQDTVRDDLAAAAAELWRATGEAAYRRAAVRHLVAVTDDGQESWRIGFDGYEMAGLPAAELCGTLGLAAAPGDAGATGCRILRAGGRDAQDRSADNAFGRAGPVTWGTVRQNQNGALVALLAGRAGLAGGERTSLRALGWFLGANPWGVRFQAGHGVDHPYHWAQLDGPGLPTGAVVGGPAPLDMLESQFPGEVELGPYDTADAVYRDDGGDWVTNEVGIPYSAAAVLLLAVLSPE
jgi:endoglucanase